MSAVVFWLPDHPTRRAFPALEPGDRIEVTLRADGKPALALLPEGDTLP